jgi:hypothetical protein
MKIQNLQFSRLLSYLLHPLLIPTIAIIALMQFPDMYIVEMPFGIKAWLVAVVFVFTFVVPVMGIFILYWFRAISSIEVKYRNERSVPLIVTSVSYLVLIYAFRGTAVPSVFMYILYSATFALLTALIINMFYKISLHSLGWAAFTATIVTLSIISGAQFLMFILTSIILSGFAGYARLKQNAHNPTQVYLGYVAGVSVVFFILLIR